MDMVQQTTGRIVCTTMREFLNVYFIAGTQDMPVAQRNPQHLLSVLKHALNAGITCFQLREKGTHALQNPQAITKLAHDCKTLCQQYKVPFFINDDMDLALNIVANGVHVGQSDTPITEVITRCAGRLLIGLSINTFEQARTANHIKAIDYFGVGPIFSTTSKTDAQASVGTELIQRIRQAGINKPIVGIGGIKTHNAHTIRQAGADGVAVISAITQAQNCAQTVQKLLTSADRA